MAHTEAIRDLIGGYQLLTDQGIDFVVAAAELQFGHRRISTTN